VVFLAFALVGAKGFSFDASLLALAAFVVGALITGRLVVHLGSRRGRLLAVTAAAEVALVAASLALASNVSHLGAGASRYVLIALLGLATGMQNASARKLAVPDLTTTVLTMTITGTAFDSRLAGGTSSRIGRRGLSAVAMFAGALVGAVTVLHVSKPLALAFALVLLVPVALGAALWSRSKPVWDEPT
jgi:uncharacterized membrane protein YoaK (UPF0700 family)